MTSHKTIWGIERNGMTQRSAGVMPGEFERGVGGALAQRLTEQLLQRRAARSLPAGIER